MEILIDRNKKLSALQSDFQKLFPFLKIEFYNQFHEEQEGSLKEVILNHDLSIKEVTDHALPRVIKISGKMTAEELETAFADIYGLSVQVFRKAGGIWIQTIATDNLTLDELNQRASQFPKIQEDTIVDSMDRQELE